MYRCLPSQAPWRSWEASCSWCKREEIKVLPGRAASRDSEEKKIQKRRKGRKTMLILIIVLLLVFGVGGGYYGHSRWGPSGGAGIGVGTILLVLLIAYMLGLFH
jgi:hypothetical protein